MRTAARPRVQTRSQRLRRTELWIWVFLLPTIVLYGVYTLYPLVASYVYSLLDWNGFDAQRTFVGLANYREVFADPLFWNSFKITALFAVVTVPARVLLALLVALLLNARLMPLRALFRTALFLPVVTTTAVVGVVMQLVFDPVSGPVNLVLTRLGVVDGGINFLGQSTTALWTVMGVYVWKWFGVTLIYWMAALQTVPEDLQEAARVDGASSAKTFWYVTLPLLRPFLIIITLLTVVDTLQVFDLMLTMTNGGPNYSTEVVEIYIYRWAFTTTIPRLGYASAAAVVFGLMCTLIAVAQALALRRSRQNVAA